VGRLLRAAQVAANIGYRVGLVSGASAADRIGLAVLVALALPLDKRLEAVRGQRAVEPLVERVSRRARRLHSRDPQLALSPPLSPRHRYQSLLPRQPIQYSLL
jgi:hypothetical protein